MRHLKSSNAISTICAHFRAQGPGGIHVDAHDFQREMMQQFPSDFALDLLTFIKDPDMFRSFSFTYGKWLAQELSGLATQTKKVSSLNLRGDVTECQEYHLP